MLEDVDLVVVSAGSSVGARDETTAAVSALGNVWCHGLAIKPGKPTLLAECKGVPVVGLPGNPLSALVVFRLVGVPLVWRAGRLPGAPARAVDPGPAGPPPRLGRRRLDVVQVARRRRRGRPAVRPLRAAVGADPGRRLRPRARTGHRPRRRVPRSR